jgi:ribosomal subunit interface protein
MDIIFRSRRTNIPERFREHTVGKLVKIEKLDQRVTRIDVEVIKEPNPRQSERRERVELTILSPGPVIRAEASADDRYTALDLAFAKLEARLRRACDRRKVHQRDLVRPGGTAEAAPAEAAPAEAALAEAIRPAELAGRNGNGTRNGNGNGTRNGNGNGTRNGHRRTRLESLEEPELDDGALLGLDSEAEESASAHLVSIPMEGDGPLVVREKLHPAKPMTIDQALLEMELIGHDFYLFHDRECDKFSVVYRRRGYDYGVIRLMEEVSG